MKDVNIFIKSMKIKDAISLYEDFFNDFDKEKMDYYLDFMNLDSSSRIRDLSKGMMEKFNLSLALSRRAKLYMLDEPISGVDPVSREKILDAILENLSEDSSMIITTHYIGELERIFDEVIFLGDGKIIEYGDAEDLNSGVGETTLETSKKTGNINIKGGIGETNISLGDINGDLKFDGGMGSITIKVPENAPIKITSTAGLGEARIKAKTLKEGKYNFDISVGVGEVEVTNIF